MQINDLPEDMIAEILLRSFEGSLLDMFENTPTFILRRVCTKWKFLVDNHPSLKSIVKSFERKRLLELARDLEEAELYHELFKLMQTFVKYSKYPLSIEERNMMAVSFKNAVGAHRASIRTLQDNNTAKTPRQEELQRDYLLKIAEELKERCMTVLSLLETYLIPNADKNDLEQIAFLYKMQGDYAKYTLEYFSTDSQLIDLARQSYETACNLVSSLPALNPIRLAIGMHYSIFLYEITHERDKAGQMLRETYLNGMAEVTDDTDINSDSMMILKLLQNNIPSWAMCNQTEDEEE